MNEPKFSRAGLAALVLSIAIFSPAVWANSGSDVLPFHGKAKGMVTGTIPPNGILIAATGTATHVGHFVRHETVFVNADGSFQGQIIFVAANGDRLNCNVSGQFTSPHDASGTYTFTGGSGRFVGASGQAEFVASTPDGANVTVRFRGLIRY